MYNDKAPTGAPLLFEPTPSLVLPNAHDYWIDSVTELRDGTIVSCAHDGAKRWSVETGRLLQCYEGEAVSKVIERDDGNIIGTTGMFEMSFKMWNKTTGECLKSQITETRTFRMLRCENKNSDLFVCATHNGNIEVRRLSDLELVSSFKMHDIAVNCISELSPEEGDGVDGLSSSSSCLFVSGALSEMTCWDLKTTKVLWSSSDSHPRWINHIVQLTGRKMIASVGEDRKIKLWKTATGENVGVLTGTVAFGYSL